MHEPPYDILVVEDDDEHAELIRRAFERAGDRFRLRTARTLARARDQLGTGPVALVIADLRLPDGLGTALLAEGGPPLVVLTAQGDERAAAAAIKAGALDYLVKSSEVMGAMDEIAVRAIAEHHQRLEAQWLRDRLIVGIMQAQDEERRHIARELHDELGQALISLGVGLERIKTEDSLEGVRVHAVALQQATEQLALGLSRMARGLYPYLLDELGFEAALEQHIRDRASEGSAEYHVELVGVEGRVLPMRFAATLFRIVQEAITNSVKHAEARSVNVVVHANDERVRLVVEDDGKGFDLAAHTLGLGLSGIRQRAKLLGGWAEIESTIGTGTVLVVQLPLGASAT